MTQRLQLLPYPHQVTMQRGHFTIPDEMRLVLNVHETLIDSFAAHDFAGKAGRLSGASFQISRRLNLASPSIQFTRDDSLFPDSPPDIRDQAYHLVITRKGIQISARAPAGTFYALQTLLQICRQAAFLGPHRRPLRLPCLIINDRPDFIRRGFYHDTARGKVPTLNTLLHLVDDLAHLKYNEFQLYVENNYQFGRHPDMYSDTDPLTPVELRKIHAACRARHIDFVPSLTSLGHFDKILSRPRYRPLAEAEPEQLRGTDINPAWIDLAPWSLCVTDPRSRKLLKQMYDDFLPNFTSPHFNICCDEAFDLGRGRSAKAAAKIGRGRLYLNWILFCNRLARRHGKSIQLWGDILINHPDLVSELPPNATILEWGYEHDHPFNEHCAQFARHAARHRKQQGGPSLYVCPGTSSWLTFASRTKNAQANIHNAARAGLEHGAKGLLLTDWGDRGHQQMLAVSLLPMAYAAAASWNLSATPQPAEPLRELLRAISLHAFADASGKAAALAYDLGLTYERLQCPRANASAAWFLFRELWGTRDFAARTPAAALKVVLARTRALSAKFRSLRLTGADGRQVIEEFRFTCDELIHTCRRTLLRQGHSQNTAALERDIRLLKGRFAKLWHARNKRSRLADVLAEFDRLIAEYRLNRASQAG